MPSRATQLDSTPTRRALLGVRALRQSPPCERLSKDRHPAHREQCAERSALKRWRVSPISFALASLWLHTSQHCTALASARRVAPPREDETSRTRERCVCPFPTGSPFAGSRWETEGALVEWDETARDEAEQHHRGRRLQPWNEQRLSKVIECVVDKNGCPHPECAAHFSMAAILSSRTRVVGWPGSSNLVPGGGVLHKDRMAYWEQRRQLMLSSGDAWNDPAGSPSRSQPASATSTLDNDA